MMPFPRKWRPKDVGEVFREVRILGRSQPGGENFAAGLARFDLRLGGAEEFRRNGLPVTGCFTSPSPLSKTMYSRGSSPCLRPTCGKKLAKE